MRGKSGVLHTGHALEDGHRSTWATVSTRVHFADVSDEEIEMYCRTGEPQNVAGGFTIDGFGGWFITGIEGDPHSVVGLSLPMLRTMLAQYGLTIADLGYPAGAGDRPRARVRRARRRRCGRCAWGRRDHAGAAPGP